MSRRLGARSRGCSEGAGAEGDAGEWDEAADLWTREAEVGELGDALSQVLLHVGAEEIGVDGDDGGDVGAGETEAREEREDGVAVGGGPEVGELLGCLECLSSGEAAGGDEVVLDGERFLRNGCGGPAVERGDVKEEGICERGCGGGDKLSEVEHGVAVAYSPPAVWGWGI